MTAGLADVRIVPMQPEHIELLMPYEQEMFGSEAWTRNGYRDELADTAHRTYVAAEGAAGELLGWAGVRVVADEAEILTVGVIPAARRRGVARRLLAELLAAARQRGAADAYLEVRVDNVAARALYADEGFAEIGVRRGYYDRGRVDAVVMHREL
ncbi:MAG TPA: ribosomal protein S18-alanine N-acetyltransferase [Jatrophihabitans sp.]|nr:ribosomal protein S18-alanine N-acetyltransferase [Jatrophihabitans sp.]